MHVRFVEPQQMPEVPRIEAASSRNIKTLTFVDKSQEKRNFVCPVCKRTFKRSEHCARHQRAHTKERPFPCQFCHRRYARRDLVVRHVRAVHPHESSDVPPRVSVPSTSSTSVSTNDDDDGHLRSGRNTTTEDGVENSSQQQASTLFSEQTARTSLPAESRQAPSGSIVQEHENVNHPIHRENFLESFHPENGVHAFKRASRNSLGEFDLLMNNFHQTTDQPSSMDIFDELNFFDPYNGISPLPNITLSPTAQTNLQEINHTTLLRSFNGSIPAIFQLSGQQQQQQPRGTQIPNVASAVPLLSPVTDPISIPTSSNLSDSYTCSPKSSELSGTSRKLRIAPLTEIHRNKIVRECEASVAHPDDTKHITLPSTNTLNQFLGTFVDVFLSHLPVIHLPTFDLDNTPTPLILSMCAIGALYRLERKLSLDLYLQSDRLLLQEWHKLARREEDFESVFSNYESRRRRHDNDPETRQFSSPQTWMIQSRVLLTWFASFTGNPTLVRKGTKDVNILVNEYHNRKRRLGPKKLSAYCSWYEWCERESEKRLLHSIFVLCSLITAAYDIPPFLAVLQDGEVELPSDDKLWVAPSEVVWQRCVAQTKCARATSILEGVSHFMNTTTTTAIDFQQTDAESGLSSSWSPFAVMIILHGVSIQFWHMSQYTELATSQQNQNLSLSTSTSTPPSLEFLLHEHNDKILDRCREQIPQQTKDPSNDGLWDETEGPLSFDCLCILRLIYLRAFTGANPIDKGILLTSDPSEVTKALQKFMSTPQTRNVYVTKTASQALEGIKTPSQVGWKLIQKTAGFKWSVDVAVFYWAFGLFFVKWIHTIDKHIKRHHQHHHHNRDRDDDMIPPDGIIDKAESSILEETRKTFLENDLMTTTPEDYDNNNNSDDTNNTNKNRSSLAAQVSRHLAVYFTDTWSWGITARFGYILRELADICERDFDDNNNLNTTTDSTSLRTRDVGYTDS